MYVTFDRPEVAAVEMVNRPPFFDSWAASLRHEGAGDGRSRITYTFHITAKPRSLRFSLMGAVFGFEVRRRLRALHSYFGRRPDRAFDVPAG